MKILAIDTSNAVMSVAFVEGGVVRGELTTNVKKDHSSRLMPAIQSLLGNCGITPSELEAIAIAKGPGSYTGVRIGVTVAKTIAWTLQIPIFGVSSLAVLAANGKYFGGFIMPLFDARRGQIYTGLYRYENNVLQTIEKDTIILAIDFVKRVKQYNKPVLLLGIDVSIHEEVLKSELGELAIIAPPSLHIPKAVELSFLAQTSEVCGIHSFVPNYIRLTEAETNWLARNGDKK